MTENEGKHTQGAWTGRILVVLILCVYYFCTWQNFPTFQAAIDTCGEPFCDFASYYYPMGEAIFRTGQPVPGYVYSPFIAILLAVFPPCGLATSLILWGTVQAVFIILYLFLFPCLVPTGFLKQLLFIALALSSFPLLHTLTWGQVGMITTVFTLGGLVFYERGHRVIAAVLLAFGICFKFFPLIFLVPFVIRRDIRFFLLTAAASGAFLFVIPVILLGIDETASFYTALLHSYRNFDWVIVNYNSQHFPHVLLRLAEATGYDVHAYLPLLRWMGYGIAAINVALLGLIQCTHLPQADLWSFHILFLTIPFVLLTSWPGDLVYISFAQGLLAWQLLKQKNGIRASRNAARMLVIFSILMSNMIFFNLLGDKFGYGSYGFIFWSNLFLLAATYVEFLPAALRQIRILSSRNLCQARLTVRHWPH